MLGNAFCFDPQKAHKYNPSLQCSLKLQAYTKMSEFYCMGGSFVLAEKVAVYIIDSIIFLVV